MTIVGASDYGSRPGGQGPLFHCDTTAAYPLKHLLLSLFEVEAGTSIINNNNSGITQVFSLSGGVSVCDHYIRTTSRNRNTVSITDKYTLKPWGYRECSKEKPQRNTSYHR